MAAIMFVISNVPAKSHGAEEMLHRERRLEWGYRMDIVELLLENHETLRGSLKSLTAMLGQPSGVGWEDRMGLDQARFSLQLGKFLADFKAHEAVEDAYLSRIVRQLGLDPELGAAIAEGHRSLGAMTHLFGTVVGVCDGEHVHRVRTVLSLLSEELERHFVYEENRVFPKLRERLPAGLLRELGHRACSKQRAGATM